MSFRVVFLCIFCFVCVKADFLTRKLCKNVDSSQCDIHYVLMDDCSKGNDQRFCTIKRNKHYTISMDFTPRFSAKTLKLAMYGDDGGDGNFSKVVKTPTDACHMLTCPVEADMRRIFDIDFTLDKTFPVAKFPIKVMLWNEENESEACCFTYNVKIHK